MSIKASVEQCKTCPFRHDGDGVKLSESRMTQIYQYLLNGTNHLCHSANNERVCWGGRNWQLEIFHRLGYIAAPTNEALAAARRETGIEPSECIVSKENPSLLSKGNCNQTVPY